MEQGLLARKRRAEEAKQAKEESLDNLVRNKTPTFSNGLRSFRSAEFEIQDAISYEGASSVIFRAQYKGQDSDIPTTVALKKLNQTVVKETPKSKQVAELTHNEAANMHQLKHIKEVPKVFGTFTEQNGKLIDHFIVLEYVDGVSLGEKIDEGTDINKAVDYIEQISGALEEIHNSGEKRRVHRDIKPGNIKVTENDRIKLLDFGSLTDKVDATLGTSLKSIQGTAKYAAPEVLTGNAKPESDFYSLGIMLYELLIGRSINDFNIGRTHESLDFDKLDKLLHDKTRNWQATRKLSNIIRKLTSENFENRYRNSNILLENLKDFRSSLSAISDLGLETAKVMTAWDVPVFEATSYAKNIIANKDLREIEKIRDLEEYLKSNPVSERDTFVIEKVIDMLRNSDKSHRQIENYLNNFDKENPELIFGFDREDLEKLYKFIFGISPDYGKKIATYANNKEFKEFVETLSTLEIDNGDKIEITSKWFNYLYEYSIESSKGYNKDKFENYLKQIKEGKLEDRIEKLKLENPKGILLNPYRKDSPDLLEDPKYLAMAFTLEDEGLKWDKTNGENPDMFKLDGQFGSYRAHNIANVVFAIAGAIVTAGTGIATTMALIKYAIDNKDLELFTGVIGGSLSVLWGGYLGGCYGANASDKIDHWLTRNIYYGYIERRYSKSEKLKAMTNLLKEISKDKIGDISPTIYSIYKENKNLTPYEVIDKVKEKLK